MKARLLLIARCVDLALFAVGLAAVLLWGWPDTLWGWSALLSVLLPFPSWVVWRLVKPGIDQRRAARVRAYRREKFGGFVALPRADEKGQRMVIPVERGAPRPNPWTSSSDRR